MPYLYVAEIGGFELDSSRDRKAERMPNPAVPFSFIALTETYRSPALPVFVESPGASAEMVAAYREFLGRDDLLHWVKDAIEGRSPDAARAKLEQKTLGLVRRLASTRKRRDSLTADQWSRAFEIVQSGNSLVPFLEDEPPLPWSKTAYIEGLTPRATALMALAAEFAIGLTSSSLPICLIPQSRRDGFVSRLKSLYPSLESQFHSWIRRKGPLVICWVMGFKPRGDDARPDRGLAPLARALCGKDTDLLSIVYGPAPASAWNELITSPRTLMARNGLWEAILATSDAILADAATIPGKHEIALVRSHWASSVKAVPVEGGPASPSPLRVGEQDVDTALHLVFARLGEQAFFEGMCNPPGGDWSGLSLLSPDGKKELRWLCLPRVTAEGAKRPDHVFQLLRPTAHGPLIVAIESKEDGRRVERGIGGRLKRYVHDLVATGPSVDRPIGSEGWCHSAVAGFSKPPTIASVAACVSRTRDELIRVGSIAKVDLVVGYSFSSSDRKSCLTLYELSPLGREVAGLVRALPLETLRMTVT